MTMTPQLAAGAQLDLSPDRAGEPIDEAVARGTRTMSSDDSPKKDEIYETPSTTPDLATETKCTQDELKRRPTENSKIKAAVKHFETIGAPNSAVSVPGDWKPW